METTSIFYSRISVSSIIWAYPSITSEMSYMHSNMAIAGRFVVFLIGTELMLFIFLRHKEIYILLLKDVLILFFNRKVL